MTYNRDRRLTKAEQLSKAPKPSCEQCGGPPLPGEPVEYEVVWDDRDLWEEDDNGAEEREAHCSTCGRQLVYTVTWDEDEAKPPHVLAWIQKQREKAREQELLAGLEFDIDE